MLKRTIWIICIFILAGCTKDEGGLSNDACDALGLPTRIINGSECGDLERSPVVGIVLNSPLGVGFCSGSMISNTLVLTAAHCFMGFVSSAHIESGEKSNPTIIEASSWSVHPDFYVSTEVAYYDIAVITLSRPLNVPTLPVLINAALEEGKTVSIFGYGLDEEGNFESNVLQSGEMKISDVTVNHIMAQYDGDGSNTCQGDSGGPLTISTDAGTAIIGITSTGTRVDCLEGDVSHFTNIQNPEVLSFLQSEAPEAIYW